MVSLQKNQSTVDNDDNRRKALIYRSWHRGTREMDILLGSFADHVVPGLQGDQIAAFEALLECPDPDLYDWYTGKTPVPGTAQSAVLTMFLGFKLTEHR